MKTRIIQGGILSIAESKAVCPHCERDIPFDEIEEKWIECKSPYMNFLCKCKRKIGITQDIMGDFVGYEL